MAAPATIDRGQRRLDVAHGRGDTGARTDSVIITARPAVADKVGDLGGGEPEVDRDRDGAEHVGRQHRLDELGAVEHQDQHAVAEADPAPAQRVGQRVDPAVEVAPTSWSCPGTAAPCASGCIMACRASWLDQFCRRAR